MTEQNEVMFGAALTEDGKNRIKNIINSEINRPLYERLEKAERETDWEVLQKSDEGKRLLASNKDIAEYMHKDYLEMKETRKRLREQCDYARRLDHIQDFVRREKGE